MDVLLELELLLELEELLDELELLLDELEEPLELPSLQAGCIKLPSWLPWMPNTLVAV